MGGLPRAHASAHRWVEPDLAELRELTGHPIRHEDKHPDAADMLPPPDAILAAPITLNALTKWADGHSDTLALGLVTEPLASNCPWSPCRSSTGRRRRIPRSVAVSPCCGSAG
ncbi:hypothetical protein ACWD26_38380 [Streptomyces sp. NPDC002787]